MNYGINSEGRFGEVDNGTLSVSGTVYRNALEGLTCTYDSGTGIYTYTSQNGSESFTDTVPDTVHGDVYTMLYNFVIWYRGTFSV